MVKVRCYSRMVWQGGDHSRKATLHSQHLHTKSRSERETVKARAAQGSTGQEFGGQGKVYSYSRMWELSPRTELEF